MMELPEDSSLALKLKTLEKNEYDLNNRQKYKSCNSIILMFYGLTIYTSISEFIVISIYFMAISASQFFSILLILVGIFNIALCVKILQAQITQTVNLKIKLALILFATLFIIKIVFFFRYLSSSGTNTNVNKPSTVDFCNKMFPMTGFYWTKMIVSILLEMTAAYCFQIICSKVRKYEIINQCFKTELEKFKIKSLG